MSIVDRNGGCYTMKCLHELYFEGHVIYAEMQKLRICVDAAKENPLHLDMGMPVKGPTANAAPEVAVALAAQPP